MDKNESFVLSLVLRYLPINCLVKLFFVSKRINQRIISMLNPIVRYELFSNEIYREYIPIGYPITERKKKYLFDILYGIYFMNTSFLDEIEYVFEFKIYVDNYYIIYSRKNNSNYHKLHIKKLRYNDDQYNIVTNSINYLYSTDRITKYVIDRNLKMDRIEEDPFEIPYFVSLIENSFIGRTLLNEECMYFGSSILYKKELKYYCHRYVSNNRTYNETMYDCLEDFVVDYMK